MIVVTAPTGDIGHQLLEHLIAAGASVRVIARDPGRLSDAIRDYVEVVEGSHGDATVVDRALNGAEALFWLVPPDPKAASVEEAYLDFTRPAAGAIVRRDVRRVVSISALGRGSPLAAQAGLVTASLAMDDLIAATGVALRALTMPSFMENLRRQTATIRDEGEFVAPIPGDLRLPSCATRDIAAVAARWLLDEDWSGQAEVPVLGPQDISFDEMASVMSDVLGHPVRFRQISLEAYRARFTWFGMTGAMAQGMADMAQAKSEGIDLSVPRTAENSTPTSFRHWCEETLKPVLRG